MQSRIKTTRKPHQQTVMDINIMT